MKKLTIVLVSLLIFSLFPYLPLPIPKIQSVNAQIPQEELLIEGKTIEQRKGDLIVRWILIKQMPYIINISVQNLLSTQRDISLETIFDSMNFEIDKLSNVSFYELKNVSYNVLVYDYGYKSYSEKALKVVAINTTAINVTKVNYYGGNFSIIALIYNNENIAKIYPYLYTYFNSTYWEGYIYTIIGNHTEVRYKLDWKPCKMQYFKKTSSEYRQCMETITLPKFGSKPKDGTFNGTKQFQLRFSTPLKFGEIKGRVALNISNTIFDPWYSSSWLYRKAITINNTKNANALTDYQVSITIDTASLISAGKMRSDCGDIRFTDSDGTTIINHWIESGINTASTKIWVKIPSIPASSTKTIYIYYGNPSATTTSSGVNTFIFFDDFANLNNWNLYGTTLPSIDANGWLQT
jgi:hypothetical protein